LTPGYAWLGTKLKCPRCGRMLTEVGLDLLGFSWGGVRSEDPDDGPMYGIGDRPLWFCDARGVVHPHSRAFSGRGANIGDPRIPDVDVFTDRGTPESCAHCGMRFFGARVEIRDAVIKGATLVNEAHGLTGRAAVIGQETGKVVRLLSLNEGLGVMPWPG
jgi:hypothetical protein